MGRTKVIATTAVMPQKHSGKRENPDASISTNNYNNESSSSSSSMISHNEKNSNSDMAASSGITAEQIMEEYDIDPETTTIEELIQILHDRAVDAIDIAVYNQCKKLEIQVDNTKKAIWKDHHAAIEQLNANVNKEMGVEGDPPAPFGDITSTSVNTNNSIVGGGGGNSDGPVKGIYVRVISGPHLNATFSLFPNVRSASLVGRSSGKKFISKGISLPQDKEISTTHGKFTIVNGTAYFTDTGSTNGTILKRMERRKSSSDGHGGEGEKKMKESNNNSMTIREDGNSILENNGLMLKLEIDEPLELLQGMVLSLGTSELEISLMS